MKSKAEEEIAAALDVFLGAVKRGEGDVGAAVARLDEVAARRRGEISPELVHFLERRSYAKARDYLRGNGAESETD